jgi:methyltransferase (TIGR00027 family)
VYEVDHPASQAWKRARLADLGVGRPANLVFAPVDFETQTLREGLEAAGFDFGQPAVFSWIGVTMYLTLQAIEATLATVAACPAGSRIVLSYNLPLPALRVLGVADENVLARIAAELGEPFVSVFEPVEVERLVLRHGFEDVVDVGQEEAIRAYLAGRDDVRLHGAQRLVVAAVGRRGPDRA